MQPTTATECLATTHSLLCHKNAPKRPSLTRSLTSITGSNTSLDAFSFRDVLTVSISSFLRKSAFAEEKYCETKIMLSSTELFKHCVSIISHERVQIHKIEAPKANRTIREMRSHFFGRRSSLQHFFSIKICIKIVWGYKYYSTNQRPTFDFITSFLSTI